MKEFVINKNVKLKKGGRKAQIMTKEKFIDLYYKYLVNYFKKYPDQYEDDWYYFEEDFGEIDNLTVKDMESLFKKNDDRLVPIWDQSQKYKVNFDWENYGVEDFRVSDSGIPCLIAWAGGDWENPVYICFYFDDKNNLRNYIPTKGNTFNRYTMTAFGSEEECDKLEEIYKKFGVDQDKYPEDSFRLEILKKEGVDLSQFQDPYDALNYLSPDLDMIMEDFSSRVIP